MKLGHEVDRVKLYNFMKMNDLKQVELSKMLGKCDAYISQVMRGHSNLSDEVIEKLAALMECEEEELYAKPNQPYSRVSEVRVNSKPEEKPQVTLEQTHVTSEQKHDDEELVIESVDDRMRRRIQALTDFISRAIVNGRRHVGTKDIVNILLE